MNRIFDPAQRAAIIRIVKKQIENHEKEKEKERETKPKHPSFITDPSPGGINYVGTEDPRNSKFITIAEPLTEDIADEFLLWAAKKKYSRWIVAGLSGAIFLAGWLASWAYYDLIDNFLHWIG